MDFSKYDKRYEKELPGADIVFQPHDLHEYENDEWDIRISVGDAPLEEAFYYTVQEPSAVNNNIDDLLNNYALNPDNRDRLDVKEYPDLPFIQEELIQYRQNAQNGLLKLEYYINYNPMPGPIELWKRAKELLCVCTYHDKSYDYRVLDLIFHPLVPYLDKFQLKEKQKRFGYIYLLLLIEHFMMLGEQVYSDFLDHPIIKAFLGTGYCNDYPELETGFRDLERKGFIKREMKDISSKEIELILTENGFSELQAIHQEAEEISVKYDKYDSVSVYPVALGIPDGFDARIQMMENDGKDCEKSVLICVLDQNKDEMFTEENWCQNYESFYFYHIVQDALAYKTNFTIEILQALIELGQYDS